MTRMPRIAFYAPLKPPDHPVPSGDREIGRLMVSALTRAGYQVEIASRFIAYQKEPDTTRFQALKRLAADEAARLLRQWSDHDEAPDLWFTYHPYCKAPDWLGPRLADTLSIPYVTVEACRTRQGTDADWQEGRAMVRAAVRMAGLNFCMKPSDRIYLQSFLPPTGAIVDLAPFIDADAVKSVPVAIDRSAFGMTTPLIVSVGMMRPGVKIASYQLLAESLSGLTHLPWNLVVVGDGPARLQVESLFAFAGERVRFTGALSHPEVLGWMAAGDLMAWPGIGEAIGMVYLEAEALGLAVAACDTANVANVVSNGRTGLLAEEPSASSFREVLGRLLLSADQRHRLGARGPDLIAGRHDIAIAAATIKRAIDPLLSRGTQRDSKMPAS
jgi:glycosyltransferase involved in cell wall biosynthesis